jgi:hypothetical protein
MVAWTMRNQIEIGDPCGAGCPNNPDYPLTAPNYTATFSRYDPYTTGPLPDEPDPLVLDAVLQVWEKPVGSSDPTIGSDYMLSKEYYNEFRYQMDVAPAEVLSGSIAERSTGYISLQNGPK